MLLIMSTTTFASNESNDHHGTTINEAKEWRIDASHSAVNFRIRHFFTPVPGVFERWGGTIKFDPQNLEGSSIDINVEVASVNTKNERRDGHLRTADFFESDTFPNMTFVSHSIRQTGENTFVATGDLTIKSTTKTIELPFELLGAMPHPSRENTTVAGFKSELSIMRNDYGVGTGDYIQTAVIGNEVSIEIFLEVNG
jgi:polyisoprenoid-binding protein YceI